MQNEDSPQGGKVFSFGPDIVATGPAYALALRMQAERRLRRQFFDFDLLTEPVWDMLLALYVAAGNREELSVTALSVASGLPTSNVVRWLAVLADRRLITTLKSGQDVESVRLTNLARDRLGQYFARLVTEQSNLSH